MNCCSQWCHTLSSKHHTIIIKKSSSKSFFSFETQLLWVWGHPGAKPGQGLFRSEKFRARTRTCSSSLLGKSLGARGWECSWRNHIASKGWVHTDGYKRRGQCASLALAFWFSPMVTLLLGQGFMSLGLCHLSERDFLLFSGHSALVQMKNSEILNI